MEEQAKKTEVVYTKARLLRRLGCYFIDLGITFFTALIMYAIVNSIVTKSGFFIAKQNELTQLRNESRLYEDGVVITTYVDNEDKYPSYKERKDEVSSRLEEFYNNSTYFEDTKAYNEYVGRKKDATVTDDGKTVHLFIVVDGNVVENSVSAEYLFNFYKDEVDNKAVGYLLGNSTYYHLTRYDFWVSVIEAAVLGTISFALYYLLFPLVIFKRGRQTLGMKLEKIGLISVRADNVTAGIYVARFFFMYGVFLLLDVVGFLIPAFVSLGMMYFSKSNSSLANYVFNDYMVDVTDQKIYFDASEREEAEIKLQEISIENRDLLLK